MFNLDLLTDNSILVCPNNIKSFLVRYLSINKPELRIKFFSKSDLKNGLSYTYDYDAVLYVSEKYNRSFSNSVEILDNLLDKPYSSKKTKLVNQIYNELIELNKLKFNPLFKHIFDNKNIYIYGYSKEDKELKNLLDKTESKYSYLDNETSNFTQKCIFFENIEDEVCYAFNDIADKLNSNIDMNKIHLMSYSGDYDLLIKKYATYFNFPVEFTSKNYLLDSPIFEKFIELLQTNSIEDSYNQLASEFPNDPFDAIGRIANVINEISNLNLETGKFIELAKFLASKTTLKSVKFDKKISLVNSNDIISDDEYVYVLGFSLGTYPRIHRDTDFFSDIEKEEISLNTSTLQSKIEEELLTNFIKNTKNLIITHKNKIGKTVYYPSLLIGKLGIQTEKYEENLKRFNIKLTKMEAARGWDSFNTYGLHTCGSNTYSENELRYNQFDHTFKGVKAYKPGDLALSYSSINKFNECPFQYFIKYVLRANVFEDRFTTNLGSLFHKILEDREIHPDEKKDYTEYINKHFESEKDKFFLKLLLPQVEKVIEKNNAFKLNSNFKRSKVEVPLDKKIDNNCKIIGFSDKILFDDEGKNLIIIDYKSGNFYFDQDKTQYGLDLQLPIYLYLVGDKYPEFTSVGIYIQNICRSKKDLSDEKNKPYRLDGLTLNESLKVERLDNSLGKLKDDKGKIIQNSQFISNLKIGSNGIKFNKDSGADEATFKQLIDTAKRAIDEAVSDIRLGDFVIRPIKFASDSSKNGKSICENCSCKSICFRKAEDFLFIDDEEKKEEK